MSDPLDYGDEPLEADEPLRAGEHVQELDQSSHRDSRNSTQTDKHTEELVKSPQSSRRASSNSVVAGTITNTQRKEGGESLQGEEHVSQLEQSLQSSRKPSRVSTVATPIVESHKEEGEIAGEEQAPPRSSRREYISIGGNEIELIDSWVAERDGRDWSAPEPREPPRQPAQFQGRMSLDSWIARRDGRTWAEPSRREPVRGRPVREAPATPRGGPTRDGPAGGAPSRGRTSPKYEPWAPSAPPTRQPRTATARPTGRERGGRQNSKRHQQNDPGESEARRDNRRDNDLAGYLTPVRTPQHAAPPPRPQQPRGRERGGVQQRGNRRELTRAEGSRTPDRVREGRVEKAYQQRRVANAGPKDDGEAQRVPPKEFEEARRVLDAGKRTLDERRRVAEERRAKESEGANDDQLWRRASAVSREG